MQCDKFLIVLFSESSPDYTAVKIWAADEYGKL